MQRLANDLFARLAKRLLHGRIDIEEATFAVKAHNEIREMFGKGEQLPLTFV